MGRVTFGAIDESGGLSAELARLRADQQDWRKGVALIASALGDKDDNLSCVRIAEVALALRSRLEQGVRAMRYVLDSTGGGYEKPKCLCIPNIDGSDHEATCPVGMGRAFLAAEAHPKEETSG